MQTHSASERSLASEEQQQGGVVGSFVLLLLASRRRQMQFPIDVGCVAISCRLRGVGKTLMVHACCCRIVCSEFCCVGVVIGKWGIRRRREGRGVYLAPQKFRGAIISRKILIGDGIKGQSHYQT